MSDKCPKCGSQMDEIYKHPVNGVRCRGRQIEILRGENAAIRLRMHEAEIVAAAKDAENERLETANADLYLLTEAQAAAVKRLTAENERLREALKPLAALNLPQLGLVLNFCPLVPRQVIARVRGRLISWLPVLLIG